MDLPGPTISQVAPTNRKISQSPVALRFTLLGTERCKVPTTMREVLGSSAGLRLAPLQVINSLERQ